jgi:hypothetical protein
MVKAVRTSETSVYFSYPTQRYIPRSCRLQRNGIYIFEIYPSENVCVKIVDITTIKFV